MYPHRIRLRGPWECVPLGLAGGGPVPSPFRVHLPCRWADVGPAGFEGRVRFHRRFGYPGNFDACERVWLTASGFGQFADFAINGVDLDRRGRVADAYEWDVTAILTPRNKFVAEVVVPPASGWAGEAALEVRREAFLRGVRVDSTGPDSLRVSGEAVGESARPLELYVVVGRRPAVYGTVQPSPDGRPFSLEAALPEGREGDAVQVDLVDGATVWYTWGHAAAAAAEPGPGG